MPRHPPCAEPFRPAEDRFEAGAELQQTQLQDGSGEAQHEAIPISVPAILDRRTFDKVQKALRAKSPHNSPPRAISGPILLTGLAYCACCGSAMTLRTGTSKSSRVYRYYSCSTSARADKSACKGRTVPVEKLDHLVTRHGAERVLMPERLEALLQSVVDRRVKADTEVQGRIDELSRKRMTAEDKLRRLYQLVDDGIAEPDDMLKEQIAKLEADRDRAHSALERIEIQGAAASRLAPDKLARFGQLMRSNITEGEVSLRKAYLRLPIDAIGVDQHAVRIHGSKTVLERAVLANQVTHPGVRSFVRKWRADQSETANTYVVEIALV